MKVIINDEPREVAPGTTVAALLAEIGLPKAAVAINDRVVRRADFDSTVIADGDKILVIKPAYGG